MSGDLIWETHERGIREGFRCRCLPVPPRRVTEQRAQGVSGWACQLVLADGSEWILWRDEWLPRATKPVRTIPK